MSAKLAGEEGRPRDKDCSIPQDSAVCKKQTFFFSTPSEDDLPCEGDSARGPRELKGHPTGGFHTISGHNAGLVSRLEWQEWGIFTFRNANTNTLMDMDWARRRLSPTWQGISNALAEWSFWPAVRIKEQRLHWRSFWDKELLFLSLINRFAGCSDAGNQPS